MMWLLWLALLAPTSGAMTRPNPALTPGLTRPLSLATVCSTRWGVDRRHITEGMKKRVAEWYGVPWADHARYEFDHLVPRSLAGADDVRNLWPQPRFGTLSAAKKDRLEVALGRLVCSNHLTLAAAQAAIRTDWVAAYDRYIPK